MNNGNQWPPDYAAHRKVLWIGIVSLFEWAL